MLWVILIMGASIHSQRQSLMLAHLRSFGHVYYSSKDTNGSNGLTPVKQPGFETQTPVSVCQTVF